MNLNIETFKNFLKLTEEPKKNLVKINLLFIFIFLNFWDFVTTRELINAMVIGLAMFGPVAFLWQVGTVRAAALVTLISLFEFMMLLVFVLEGFQLSGGAATFKSLFWLPFLLMAGANGFVGLKIYTESREKKPKP